jgi:hypothetical protein
MVQPGVLNIFEQGEFRKHELSDPCRNRFHGIVENVSLMHGYVK